MAPRIHLKKGIAARNEWALFDSQTERIYQRIYGGIVLQGHRGAAAVVAEEASLRPPVPQYLVGLATAMDAAGIIERATEFKQDLHCSDWYNDYNDLAALRFLDQFNNRERDRRGSPLSVGKAAHADIGLAYFLNVLKEALTPGKRLLHLEEHEGQVNAALSAIASVEITTAKFEDHPLVAALSMAVAPLVAYPYIYGQERPKFAQTEYDVLTREPAEQRRSRYSRSRYSRNDYRPERALTEGKDIFNH